MGSFVLSALISITFHILSTRSNLVLICSLWVAIVCTLGSHSKGVHERGMEGRWGRRKGGGKKEGRDGGGRMRGME